MCNLYTCKMTPEIMASIKRHYTLIGQSFQDALQTNDGRLYPYYPAPVGVLEGGAVVARRMLWGFPPFVSSKAPVTHVRNVGKGYWKGGLGREHRCLVPAAAFRSRTSATICSSRS